MKSIVRNAMVAGSLSLLLATSANAEIDMRVRGLLDLGVTTGSQSIDRNLTTFGDTNFDPYRLRLFLDAAVADGLDIYVQTLLDENFMGLRADGAYLMWTPWNQRDLHLEAGKIPWPIGTWAPRKYSDKNPLIGEPLMYQHHTSNPWNVIPVDADDLVRRAGLGQSVVQGGDWVGMPVVDDRWWDAGVVAIGSTRPLEFALGVTQGSPGWPEPGHEDTPGQSVLGRLGYAPSPAFRVGVSGSHGPWIPRYFASALPAGGKVTDYMESLAMADLELLGSRGELHAEAFVKDWETVNTGTLRTSGGYLEARVGIGAGAWLAMRGESMRFSDVVTTADPGGRPWDDPRERYELGVGVRATREVRLKLSVQRDVLHRLHEPIEQADVLALSSSIRF